MQAVDCQGLAGGFTMGTVQAGFDIVAKLELDNFGTDNTERNAHLLGTFPHILGEENWPEYDVPYVFGNPPCSGFSLMNTAAAIAAKRGTKATRARGADSPINDCMWSLAHYVARVTPKIAVFESVQGAGKYQGRVLMRKLRDKVVELSGVNYDLTHVFMNGLTVGGAQNRRRYFWVIHRVPFGVNVTPVVAPTIHDVIGDLVGLKTDTWDRQEVKYRPGEWAKREVGAGKYIDAHIYDQHTTHGRRVRNLAQTGLWEVGDQEEDAACLAFLRDGELPDGFAFDDPITKNWGFYQTRRLVWEKHMYVMAGNGLQAFIHPTEDRSLTVREGSRLMGYPDAWDWSAARHVGQVQNWQGKGLLVQAGRWMSTQVRDSLEGKVMAIQGQPIPEKDHKQWAEKCPDDAPVVAGEYVINITNLWKEWVISG